MSSASGSNGGVGISTIAKYNEQKSLRYSATGLASSPYSGVATLTVLVNNYAVWVLYPSSISKADMIVFLRKYYEDHPGKFRPYETLELSRYEILGSELIDDINFAYRERCRKYSKTAPHLHGTALGYEDGCRCKNCKESRSA
jgi:hypothetical protein